MLPHDREYISRRKGTLFSARWMMRTTLTTDEFQCSLNFTVGLLTDNIMSVAHLTDWTWGMRSPTATTTLSIVNSALSSWTTAPERSPCRRPCRRLSTGLVSSSFSSLRSLRLFAQLLLANSFSNFYAMSPFSRYKLLIKIRPSLWNGMFTNIR